MILSLIKMSATPGRRKEILEVLRFVKGQIHVKTGCSICAVYEMCDQRNSILYVDSQKEPVMLSVKFGLLNDGTIYVPGAELDAKGKSLKVTIENSGYRKMGQ